VSNVPPLVAHTTVTGRNSIGGQALPIRAITFANELTLSCCEVGSRTTTKARAADNVPIGRRDHIDHTEVDANFGAGSW
jgi:hypothetical protein